MRSENTPRFNVLPLATKMSGRAVCMHIQHGVVSDARLTVAWVTTMDVELSGSLLDISNMLPLASLVLAVIISVFTALVKLWRSSQPRVPPPSDPQARSLIRNAH